MGLWTPAQDQILRDMVADKKSASQIAKRLGVTRNAVIGRASRIGARLASRTPGLRATHSRRGKRQKLTAIIFRLPKDRKPPPVTKAFIKSQEQFTGPLNLTILEVKEGQCKYPVTRDHPFLFCGHPATGDSSYCEHHRLICTEAPSPRKRVSVYGRAA